MILVDELSIVPNIQVNPTLTGVRAGRDEVLEQAVRQIVGEQVPRKEIEKHGQPSSLYSVVSHK